MNPDAGHTDVDRPPRLQFHLRTLLLVVALFSAVFAAANAIGAVWMAALGLVAALILAHVAGNAIGTRLRDEATQRTHEEQPLGEAAARIRAAPLPVAETTRLHERRPLGLSLLVMTGAGAVSGALLGRLTMAYGQWGVLSTADWVLGLTSCAVLGGLAGAAASSFFQMALWPAVLFFFQRGGSRGRGVSEKARSAIAKPLDNDVL
jgi:hypothetical protein